MHADELEIDDTLVRALLEGQFPGWAGLSLERVRSSGTDNALFRLGDDLVVRVPRIASATEALDKELRWLPVLAPQLPLEVPVPVARGEPAEGFPWRWSVYRWLEGEVATDERIADRHTAAVALGRFVSALHAIDPRGGPGPGVHNSYRGRPLATRDAETREAIAAVAHLFETGSLTAAWESALEMPTWEGAGVWVHGDLIMTNLLARDGGLSAVIDWGCLGVGDPACDAMAGWSFLGADTRNVFRAKLGMDDATWARGRGWALSWGLIALPFYERTNRVLAELARRTIAEVLADPGG
jgi:aminoglycoside phosphotransferase (APT) family kinase protein